MKKSNKQNNDKVSSLSKMRVCMYPWFSPMISCYGDVGVCCNDIHFLLKVGNIKQDSLKNIWLNKNAERLRFLHITNQLEKTPEKICLNCRQTLKVPTLNDEYVIDYLKTIHREDLIDFYKNRIRKEYGIDFQYKEENNSQVYPIYPNLIKTKHFRIKGEYVGSDEKLTFYLKIPKNISLLQIKLPLTGIKGKSTFTAILNNKSLGTFTVNQMSKGDAEIIELTTDDVKDLIKREIVKFELQVSKGNLAIYEKYKGVNGIKITYPRPLKPSNEYSIYTPYRNGQVIEYNNQDNFNKGYKFLILEENSELFYPLKHDVSELQVQLASITENTIAQINSNQIKPIQLASGKGKIYKIKIKSNLIKIKCKKGKLAVLQDPIEPNLPKTPLQVKYLN